MKKTHTIAGNRKVTHAAWFITQCPCFKAEYTIWWFLSGQKEWTISESLKYGSWKAKYEDT